MKRPRRPWKRTLLVVLLLLTGGAIINVAVAWGCAQWSIDQTEYYKPSGTTIGYERRAVDKDVETLWSLTKDARGRGLHLRVYESANAASVLEDFIHYSIVANTDLAAMAGQAAVTYATEEDLYHFTNGRQHSRLQTALKKAEQSTTLRSVAQQLRSRLAAIASPSTAPSDESDASLARIETIYIIEAGGRSALLMVLKAC